MNDRYLKPVSHHLLVLSMLTIAVLSSVFLINRLWSLPLVWLVIPPDTLSLAQMATQLQIVPTMLMAILAGGVLGLASVLLQQLIKNPLVSDTTLSVGAGANMSLLLATLFLPSTAFVFGEFGLCFIGALFSLLLVFLMAKKGGMQANTLVLSGLVVNILFSSVAAFLTVFYSEAALSVMLWGAGSVLQSGYAGVWLLAGVLIFSLCVLMFMYRSLVIVSLDEEQAASLGVPVKAVQGGVLVMAALMVASVVSQLGMLSFVGLGAATLANMLSGSRLAHRLWSGFGYGALLLLIAQNATALLRSQLAFLLPEGVITGIFGSLLIIYLIIKSQKHSLEHSNAKKLLPRKIVWWRYVLLLIAVLMMALLIMPRQSQLGSLLIMNWAFIEEFRLSRTLFAMATGVLLSCAGVILQALTKNSMASPEVLGISSAAALGVVVMFVLAPMMGLAADIGVLIIGGTLGALLVCALLFILAKYLSPVHLLLVGIAISAFTSSILAVIKLAGDMRIQAILSWLAGTTYYASLDSGMWLIFLSVLLFVVAYLITKPLQIISLSDDVATSLGVSLKFYQLVVLTLVALMSSAATLAVGPLSFVGLMIPHLAQSLGAVRLREQLPLAALLGAVMMVLADYLGRYLIFPYEISMGVIASLIGGVYFIYLMMKNR
ncbi:iron complex transport system permease protein [Moraxella cuniculi DSM 21768]|uniref:Iron complex transport system permease protein n=1 Tax=Moraxella cuniculi DSM 21768 TaxID=1122245 RepID=A0A1N7EJT9_9GAMM|nr:iron ABC transporter permease [Moraxella cuniculi]OOS07223.1 hypothetical protein B0189_03420 [Moraxella cuniculi]SIR88351.1 iron complex transport system permease protein [Moraxella cuniculi DSM 21768]